MKTKAAAFFLFAFASSTALAHPESGAGLLHGFVHPFTGLDHLAAMLIVGAWAACSAGVSRFALPGAFLAGLGIGALAARAGAFLPGVEAVVLASAVVLVAAFAFRVRTSVATVLVAAIGSFHGFAHIAGLPAEMPFAAFSSGMLAGSALLHAIGLAIGLAVAAAKPRVA